MDKKMLLSGNEALALGAYEAGLGVAAAYPGTPSTEILEYLAQFDDLDTQWSVNEKVAFEVAYGAAIGGARSLYASKHVGLNVAMDPLMTSSYTGINGGFVVVVCDDPGMHSSQNEQDTRWVSMYAKLPLLEPSSPSEAYIFVKEALEMSEVFDTPVLVRMTTRVSHTKESITVGRREKPVIRDYSNDVKKYVMVPGNAYYRHIFVEERAVKLKEYAETSEMNRIEQGSRQIGFITSSAVYNYIKDAYPDASILKLGFSYPFCDEKIKSFAQSVTDVYCIEELDPILENHIKTLGIDIKAKDPSFMIGELSPDTIPQIVSGEKKVENRVQTRIPQLCTGCPHHNVFKIFKKLELNVMGDIGCYTLGALPPYGALHSCLCMGGGVTLHEGLRRAHNDRKTVGVVGDSTFVHSGITGLINAVYNKSRGVIVILDNHITAMTGGQQHPATGITIKNEPTAKLNLEDLCKSVGVAHVDVIAPHKVDELEALLQQRLEEDALSVIITRSPCILLLKKQKSTGGKK